MLSAVYFLRQVASFVLYHQANIYTMEEKDSCNFNNNFQCYFVNGEGERRRRKRNTRRLHDIVAEAHVKLFMIENNVFFCRHFFCRGKKI